MSTAVTGSQCRQEAEQARAVAGKGTRPVPGAIHHRDPPQSIPCGNTYPGNVMFCSNPPPLCYKTTGPPSRFPRHDHPPHALKQPRSLPGWGGGRATQRGVRGRRTPVSRQNSGLPVGPQLRLQAVHQCGVRPGARDVHCREAGVGAEAKAPRERPGGPAGGLDLGVGGGGGCRQTPGGNGKAQRSGTTSPFLGITFYFPSLPPCRRFCPFLADHTTGGNSQDLNLPVIPWEGGHKLSNTMAPITSPTPENQNNLVQGNKHLSFDGGNTSLKWVGGGTHCAQSGDGWGRPEGLWAGEL